VLELKEELDVESEEEEEVAEAELVVLELEAAVLLVVLGELEPLVRSERAKTAPAPTRTTMTRTTTSVLPTALRRANFNAMPLWEHPGDLI
jgi:hypothetical protein